MRGKRERWVGEWYDAEGRRWRLWSAPWFVRSRVLVRVNDDGAVVECPAAEKSREALVMTLGAAFLLAAVVVIDGGKFAPELWVGVGLILLGIWAITTTYRGIRRFAVARDRFAAGECPNCAYQLMPVGATAEDTVRCQRCGHLWAWPRTPIESPAF